MYAEFAEIDGYPYPRPKLHFVTIAASTQIPLAKRPSPSLGYLSRRCTGGRLLIPACACFAIGCTEQSMQLQVRTNPSVKRLEPQHQHALERAEDFNDVTAVQRGVGKPRDPPFDLEPATQEREQVAHGVNIGEVDQGAQIPVDVLFARRMAVEHISNVGRDQVPFLASGLAARRNQRAVSLRQGTAVTDREDTVVARGLTGRPDHELVGLVGFQTADAGQHVGRLDPGRPPVRRWPTRATAVSTGGTRRGPPT